MTGKKLIILFFLISSACKAQDSFFSQYNSNAIYLNPAFAGSFENGIFTAAYRNQWPEFNRTYITHHFSFNKYYSKLRGGLGAYYIYDSAGDGTVKTHNVLVMYAPHFQLKNSIVIKPAVALGYVNKSLNWNKLYFGDMVDPRYGFIYPVSTTTPKQNVSNFDVSSGILVYNRFFSAGAAFNHINEPDESFITDGSSHLPLRYTLHGSLNFSIQTKDSAIGIQPSVVYAKQGSTHLSNIGFTLKYKWFLTGLYYQENYSDIGLMLGFQKKRIRINYSYDLGNLKGFNVSTHEFFISYSLPNKKQKTEGMLFNNSFAF